MCTLNLEYLSTSEQISLITLLFKAEGMTVVEVKKEKSYFWVKFQTQNPDNILKFILRIPVQISQIRQLSAEIKNSQATLRGETAK